MGARSRVSLFGMRILPLSFVLALAACGGSAPKTDSPAAPAPPASATPAAPAPATPAETVTPAKTASPEAPKFATMTKEQKLDHMKNVVSPRVGKVFQEADAKKYANFGCATCHGAKKANPHDHLPKLTLSNGGFEKLQKSKPEIMKLMADKVVPEMAAAMNEKPYDPATKQGFGCAGCHTVD